MQISQIARTDDQRVEALQALGILDTPADSQLDFITRMVKEHFNVPIALISLVDKNRQWFKSKQGLTASETPREISFCTHAIMRKGVFKVSNAIEDPRFKDNPLVLGSPHIRFYAGSTITTLAGYPIGTLCIIDSKARKLTADEESDLQGFSGIVEDYLNKCDPRHHLEGLLDHAHEGLFEINADNNFIFINEYGAKLLGYEKQELIGRQWSSIFPKKRFDGSAYRAPVFAEKVNLTTKASQQTDEYLLKKDGESIHASCHFEPVIRAGKVDSILMSFFDDFERDALRAEINWQHDSIEKILSVRIAALKLTQDSSQAQPS